MWILRYVARSSPPAPTWTLVLARFSRRDALHDRAGDQLYPQLARDLARPRDRRPVECLGPRRELLGRAEQVPLLRQHDEFGTIADRRPHEPIRGREVAILVLRRVELDGAGAH
jgi:hypothetical protein